VYLCIEFYNKKTWHITGDPRRCGCSSRGLLCRICIVFARRVRIGGLLLLAKGNRGGGGFSAIAIGKVHWIFPSPLNTLNIGSNKRNVTNLSDWISNQVYRLCSDAERFR